MMAMTTSSSIRVNPAQSAGECLPARCPCLLAIPQTMRPNSFDCNGKERKGRHGRHGAERQQKLLVFGGRRVLIYDLRKKYEMKNMSIWQRLNTALFFLFLLLMTGCGLALSIAVAV